jgi:tubulin alpha
VYSYLLEHGLKADGKPDPDCGGQGEGGSYETFFNETSNGKFVPRSIFVDLDPSVRLTRNLQAGIDSL